MGWCEQQLKGKCIFAGDRSLRERHCPEQNGGTCTLVHVMLTVHQMPPELRRQLIAALYPAYGIAGSSGPEGSAGAGRGRRSRRRSLKES